MKWGMYDMRVCVAAKVRVKWGMYDMRVCVAAKVRIEGEVGDV